MSASSSDSESSCGWTIINNEGSDIETLQSEHGEQSTDLVADENSALLEDVEEQAKPLEALCSRDGLLPASEITPLSLEETKPLRETEDEKLPEDSVCIGTPSDDSDIVTLEPPKVEEVGTEEKALAVDEEAEDSEDLNLGSSSSSQYTFSQPETVFPSRHTTDESSNDEVSDSSGPTPRRRRAKRKTVSGSESEDRAVAAEFAPLKNTPEPLNKRSSLNVCIILALVIAVSMGFGHFYGKPEGTIQIQERQRYVEKIHEVELNDVKDDLHQCQKEQVTSVGQKLEAEDLVTCLEVREVEFQKKNLAAENMHLKESLEKGEKALCSLQEELRKLREEIRNLEEKGTGTESVLTENQKLKEHLEEGKLRIDTVLRQKETLLTEAQLLRSELDKERHNTKALREELKEYSYTQSSGNINSANTLPEDQEIENMQERLKELEKKLTFEQQRSDLWERLYIEARENSERQETGSSGERKEYGKTKKKPKDSFFGSVKDTFDAMKNSTKEFVRHHKEKIKEAKQAVKEKLKKFSDSVKSTFRHFKDSTKSMFDRNRNKKKDESRRGENPKAKPVFKEFHNTHRPSHSKKAGTNAETMQAQFKDSNFETFEKDTNSRKCSHGGECDESQPSSHQGCSGVFECAHKESVSLFNKVLDPVKAEEFTHLMHSYLQQEVDEFHHWKELEKFINRFFHNGVFIHDRMLFTDFVNDVEHYLEDLKEYQMSNDGVFEDLDEFVYRHFFGATYSTAHGASQAEARPPYKNAEGPRNAKRFQKPHQHPRHKREGKWHKEGGANGRHMASLEIELGPLPFDPKY